MPVLSLPPGGRDRPHQGSMELEPRDAFSVGATPPYTGGHLYNSEVRQEPQVQVLALVSLCSRARYTAQMCLRFPSCRQRPETLSFSELAMAPRGFKELDTNRVLSKPWPLRRGPCRTMSTSALRPSYPSNAAPLPSVQCHTRDWARRVGSIQKLQPGPQGLSSGPAFSGHGMSPALCALVAKFKKP